MNKSNVATRKLSHEGTLLDLARRLAKFSEMGDQIVVHLHLSNLDARRRGEAYLRVTASTFEPLVQKRAAQVFILANGDIVFLGGRSTDGEVKDLLSELQQMYAEDSWFHDALASTTVPFAVWYMLPRDADSFVKTCEQLYQQSIAGPSSAADGSDGDDHAFTAKEAGAAELDLAQKNLETIDLKGSLRRQSVGIFLPGQPANRLFSEMYVSVLDLHKRLTMNADIAQNRWLFQHFTTAMDRAILSRFTVSGIPKKSGSISLNMNVSSILSLEFLAFDNSLSGDTDEKIIIELQQIDVFDDMAAYKFAANFLRQKKYAICIDGVTHLTFPFIDRERLGADFVKIIWSADMAGDRQDNLVQRMKNFVNESGANSVILCRCDTRESIEWGQAAGIRLFQGRIVETLLESMANANRQAEAAS